MSSTLEEIEVGSFWRPTIKERTSNRKTSGNYNKSFSVGLSNIYGKEGM